MSRKCCASVVGFLEDCSTHIFVSKSWAHNNASSPGGHRPSITENCQEDSFLRGEDRASLRGVCLVQLHRVLAQRRLCLEFNVLQ
jgi:hypothetical protein